MTKDEIVGMFPIDIEITQDILNKAVITDCAKCIGALALKTVFPKQPVTWGVYFGEVYSDQGDWIQVMTEQHVRVTSISKPRTIKFIIGQ